MSGTLFLIPVALGDAAWPEYLPQRSRDIACQLTHFAVENAKSARAELKRLAHPVPLRELSIEEIPATPNGEQINSLLSPLHVGHDLGVMSEAGCPGVADPGARLVARAHELGIHVVPLTGPSSILLALMASGFNGQQFAFHGYLPARETERNKSIIALENDSRRSGQTQIFIETPYRNDAMFTALINTCQPESRLCLACNLTHADEYIAARRISAWRMRTAPTLHHKPTVFLLSAS